MKLYEAEDMLPRNKFVSPHKGYIVNLDYVNTVEENELSLINDIRIPISRRQKREFEQALFRFIRRLQ
jgi:DNA-binding LytR/AlgR family response regulator